MDARRLALGETLMSAPVSAMITSAMWACSRAAAGPGISSASPVRLVQGGLSGASIRSRNSRAMKRRWSLNRPVRSSLRAGVFGRILVLARPGQHMRVFFTADERFEHGAPGNPGDVGGDRGEFDARSPPASSSRWISRERSSVMCRPEPVRSRCGGCRQAGRSSPGAARMHQVG